MMQLQQGKDWIDQESIRPKGHVPPLSNLYQWQTVTINDDPYFLVNSGEASDLSIFSQ